MENRSPSFPTEAFAESAGVFSAIAMLTTRAEGLNAHMLSDLRIPTLSIECESCGRAGGYNVAKLIERYGDAKLPELLYVSPIARRRDRRASMTGARPSTARTAAGARQTASSRLDGLAPNQGGLTMTEPVTVSDLKVLVTAAEEISALFDYDTPWWRGHAKAEWSLQAQVFRPERHSTDDEMALMGHFVSRAPSRSHRPCPLSDDHFGWLFLAQHYGLPTRLLDWSENPLVAAFFAVLQEPVDDGCIWGMWPTGLNHAFGVPLGLIQIRDPKVRESAKSAFTGITPPDEAEVLAIDGQENDPRMLAQMGRFTIHSTRTPLEQGPDSANWLRQYMIPREAKTKIRAQLSAFGVQLPNLFPDLGSLAADLKRRGKWASYG